MRNRNAFYRLRNLNVDSAPEEELRDLVRHLQYQFDNPYVYLVGRWANGNKAKSTRTGKMVRKEEVRNYLR
jgi:hypothetical protein